MAIDRDILIAAQRRQDNKTLIYSMDFQEMVETSLGTLKKRASTAGRLCQSLLVGFAEHPGHHVDGYNLAISGNVPQGAGLSSSAALEVATARAVTCLGDWQWEPVRMAKICQKAEREFVGVNCGIMDQLAIIASQPGKALFLDCRSFEYENIPVAFKDTQFVAVYSGLGRQLKTSEYNTRRQECGEALSLLNTKNPKYTALRDLGIVAFERYKSVLPEVPRKRAEHVVYENERVNKAKAC